MGIERIVCCYHKLTAYFIQYALFIINFIGFLFSIIGFSVIKWEYIPSGGELVYVICFIIYILSEICISILIYFRSKKTINGRNNRPSKNISIVNIILSIIGIIFSFICLIVCWVEYDDNKNVTINGEKAISGWNRFFMFLILGINSRCMGFLFFFWTSILIRLIQKTNGAYIEKNTQVEINNTSVTEARDVSINYGTRQINLK